VKQLLIFTTFVLACLLGPSVMAIAQETPSNSEQMEALSPDQLYKLAETYRTGEGVERDLDRAVSIYKELAADGHARSWFRLGKHYLKIGRGADAMRAFEESARQGYDRAAAELAIGHARSRFGSLSDPSLGFSWLVELAAAQEDKRVLFELAEAYYAGRGTDRDLKRAFELYTTLAGVAHNRALYRIGEFYRRGLLGPADPMAAIAAYQAAVDAGYEKALLKLGEVQMSAGLGQEALQSLDRAAALDLGDAEVMLAIGHFREAFGEGSNPESGLRELARLAEQGNIEAAKIVLKLHEERSTRLAGLDLTAVLAHLETAAEGGERSAAETLARAYRKLDRYVPDARAKHARVVKELGDQIRPSRLVVEELYTAYDPKAAISSRPALAKIIEAAPEDAYVSGMLALRSLDKNALVYVLQGEMKDAGLYAGPVSGDMTASMLQATMRYCGELGVAETCRHGPLNRDAVKLIVEGLQAQRQLN